MKEPKMDATTVMLLSLVVHLVEYIDTGEPTDINAANGVLQLPGIAEALKPGALVPVTRSGKSIAEIIESKC